MQELTLLEQLEIYKADQLPYVRGVFVLQGRLKIATRLIEKEFVPDDATKPILDELIKQEAYVQEYDALIAELEAQLKAQEKKAETAAKPSTNGHKRAIEKA